MDSSAQERQRIQGALKALCAARGYAGLETTEVCGAAGVSETEFHRHFADLDECFAVVVEEGTAGLLAFVGGAFLEFESWRERFRACAWALLDYLRADPEWARLMVTETPEAPPRARAAREGGMEALATLLDLARGETEDPGSIPPDTASHLAGAIYSRVQLAVEADGLAHGEELVPELLYVAVSAYFGPEAALEELEAPRPQPGGCG